MERRPGTEIASVRAKVTERELIEPECGGCVMTHVMAEELGHYGIRVNCVALGGIRGTSASSPTALPPEYPDRLRDARPLRRWGTPDEIAAVVLFLASDEASYVNGVVIPVDGRTALTPATI
jgi:NAD(P)-dependent dehydrogenase (short-subunit alcohol dehydrogenase family)